MRVLVCGGRNYENKDQVWKNLERLRLSCPHDSMIVIQGGAPGADAFARIWCSYNYVPYDNYPADWKKHGRAAGPIRNQRMIDEGHPDLVLAFPGGRGTADMLKRAVEAGITIEKIDT